MFTGGIYFADVRACSMGLSALSAVCAGVGCVGAQGPQDVNLRTWAHDRTLPVLVLIACGNAHVNNCLETFSCLLAANVVVVIGLCGELDRVSADISLPGLSASEARQLLDATGVVDIAGKFGFVHVYIETIGSRIRACPRPQLGLRRDSFSIKENLSE